MRATNAKFNLVFEVEDNCNANKLVVHAQRIFPYSITHRAGQASIALKQQAKNYDAKYHPAHFFNGIRKKNGRYEVLVKWLGFEDGNSEI